MDHEFGSLRPSVAHQLPHVKVLLLAPMRFMRIAGIFCREVLPAAHHHHNVCALPVQVCRAALVAPLGVVAVVAGVAGLPIDDHLGIQHPPKVRRQVSTPVVGTQGTETAAREGREDYEMRLAALQLTHRLLLRGGGLSAGLLYPGDLSANLPRRQLVPDVGGGFPVLEGHLLEVYVGLRSPCPLQHGSQPRRDPRVIQAVAGLAAGVRHAGMVLPQPPWIGDVRRLPAHPPRVWLWLGILLYILGVDG
mmetsp:Transcript_22461/g.62305  ORF Transcript_22461/g.62305 Transcript_22461/m.62305 type:complete len:249 (-) Transcript_22461:322-1068(-)